MDPTLEEAVKAVMWILMRSNDPSCLLSHAAVPAGSGVAVAAASSSRITCKSGLANEDGDGADDVS